MYKYWYAIVICIWARAELRTSRIACTERGMHFAFNTTFYIASLFRRSTRIFCSIPFQSDGEACSTAIINNKIFQMI